jgi:hypothetical protein
VENVNARYIIPFAIGTWLLFIAVFATGAPGALQAAAVVVFVVATPALVLFLLGEAGWRRLAREFKAREPFNGEWKLCPTGQMALVSVDHPQFGRRKARFLSVLRTGTDPEALHFSTLGSGIPVLSYFFPRLRIPWSAVTSARTFEAPGWVTPVRDPGTLLQVEYDPNYTGTFVELVIGEPPVFVQLPAALFGAEVAAKLGIDVAPETAAEISPPAV